MPADKKKSEPGSESIVVVDSVPETGAKVVEASLPSSAEKQDAVAAAAEKTSASSPGKKKDSPSNVLGYLLTNFVLPSPERSKVLVTRLHASNGNLGSYGLHDSNLAFVGYGLLFVSEVLKYTAASASTRAPTVASPLARQLLTNFAGHASALVAPTGKLSGLISDIRIFNRLWGLVPLSVWALETWAQPPQDPVLRGVAYAQVAANLVYQPLENVAYLAMHGVVPETTVSVRAQTLLWIYSCYFWALHVVLEFVRLYRERQFQRSGKMERNDFAWYQGLISNLSYLPLTVHWSLETPLLNDMTVGFLGATAAASSIFPRWKAILSATA